MTSWILQFDGAYKPSTKAAGVGVKLTSPGGEVYCYSKSSPACTCNQAEYSALIFGLQKAQEHHIQQLEVRGDSQLVCEQVSGRWKVRSEGLAPRHQQALELCKQFVKVKIQHIPRSQNSIADFLAREACTLTTHETSGCTTATKPQAANTSDHL